MAIYLNDETRVAFAQRMEAERVLLKAGLYAMKIRQLIEFNEHTYGCTPQLVRTCTVRELRALADHIEKAQP